MAITYFTTTAVQTYAANNAVTLTNLSNIFPGMSIVFSGNVFGNIAGNTQYYVSNVVSQYGITISNSVGGFNTILANGTGSMTATLSTGGQAQINTGAIPNDGTGDPLRTAFTETNLNFDQIYAAGPVGSNVRIANNAILTTNTNGNLVLNPNGIGNVVSNAHVKPDQTRIRNLGSPDLLWLGVYAQTANIASNVAIGGDMLISGNLQVNGNLTYIDSNVVDIKDKNITLAYGSPNAQVANGGGITIAGANAEMYYNYAGNNWTFNLPIATANIVFPDGSVLDTANTVHIGNTALNKGDGNLWWNSNDGRGYVKYNNQWIEFSPPVIPNPAVYLGNLTIDGDNNSTLYFPPDGNIVFGDGSIQSTAYTGAANVDFTNIASNIIPATNNTYSLGNATNQWASVYVGANTLYLNNVPVGVTGNTLTVNGANVVTAANGTVTGNNISVTGKVTANAITLRNTDDYAQIVFSNDGGSTNNGQIKVDGGTNMVVSANNNFYVKRVGQDRIAITDTTADFMAATNVRIQSNKTGNTNTWTFDSSGNLSLPGAVNYQVSGLGNSGHFDINSWYPVNISTGDSVNEAISTWNFGYNGTLTLPGNIVMGGGNSIVLDSSTGNAYIAQTMGLQIAGEGGISLIVNDGEGDFNTVGIDVYGNIQTPGSITATSISASGNVTGNYILGNGSQLTGLPATYGNANVTALLSSGSVDTPIVLSGANGNITGYNFFVGGNINAPGEFTSVNFGASYADYFTFSQYNRVDTNVDIVTTANLSAIGNVLGANFVGNVIGSNGNSVGINSFYANGSSAVSFAVGADGNVNIQTYQGAGLAGVWTFDNTGVLTIAGNINGDGASPAPSLNGFDTVGALTISAAGNVYGNYFVGNVVGNLVKGANSAGFDAYGDFVLPTSVYFGTGSNFSLQVTANSAGALIAAPQTGQNLIFQTNSVGPVYHNMVFDNTGNLLAPGIVSATGGVYSNTIVLAQGNIRGGNLISSGSITATGNITGNYILGNGSQLTGLPATYGNANVTTFLAAYGSNSISTSGNITAGNLVGNISIVGNVSGTSANVQLVAGSYTWTFDNTGNLNIPATGDIILSNSQSMISAVGNINAGNVNVTGNVITPNRPAFRVYGNSSTIWSTTTNTNGILNANNWVVDYNQGGYLNSSTGVFTAPVAGLYQLNLVCRVANNTSLSAQAIVIKNYGSGNVNQVMWESANNPTINHFGVSTTSKLAAGDTLTLKITVGSLIFDSNDNWSVVYLG